MPVLLRPGGKQLYGEDGPLSCGVINSEGGNDDKNF